MNYDESERRYADLKNKRNTGQISPEEFTKGVHELRVQDYNGVWWQIREKDGGWLRWNGSAWEDGNPFVTDLRNSTVRPEVTKKAESKLEWFHSMNADQKRTFVVFFVLAIAAIYALFIFFNIGGQIGSALNIGNVFGGSPENVITEYLNVIDSGDYSRAANLLVSEAQKPRSVSEQAILRSSLSSLYGSNGDMVEYSDIKITSSQKINDTKYRISVSATQKLKSLYFGSQTSVYKKTFTVVMVDGNWKIVYDYSLFY